MKKLVIVESPSKSKTIEKYLGNDYQVVSSKGHIRDLATSGKGGLGIDVENGFEPTYKVNKDKKEVVKELKKLAKKADEVYLASDPDREGEAIAWHLAQELKLNVDDNNRIIFNEITKNAIIKAFENPRQIDNDLVKSQEARRMLDRIIGFKLSKLLQNKIRSKSAGRVQSVALRLIVEKEDEINKFVSKEYWTIDLLGKIDKHEITFKLAKYNDKKIELNNEEDCNKVVDACANNDFIISKVEAKNKKKQPKLAFITSTLQQEASTKLGFSAKKTMQVAQKLYEGITISSGIEGLISYMRTDSTRLSDVFVNDTKSFIKDTYGEKYIGNVVKANKANAQDAHEAIRPTSIIRTPDSVKKYLNNDQYKLYKLIYARTLASLMAPAINNVVSVVAINNNYEFNTSGSVQTFDGYLKVYGEFEQSTDVKLPEIKENDKLEDAILNKDQHFTEPPLRYSEARLIKELEEKGIGRPSTYSMILDTLQVRGYALLEKPSEGSKTKVFKPTDQGILTDSKLQEFFSSIINVSYTAEMEENLDAISEGKLNNIDELSKFYSAFEPLLNNAYEHMEKKELERTGDKCPECGNELVYREGRYGKFISCLDFPNCKYTKSEEENEEEEPQYCEKCGGKLVHKKGRFGAFLACSNYPECKNIVSLNKKTEPEDTGEICPDCGGKLLKRQSRYKTFFIGCSNYPKCKYVKNIDKKSGDKDE